MSDVLKPDPARAVEFLMWLNPGVSMHIESMASVGPAKPRPRQFDADQCAQAVEFVSTANGAAMQRNMYFLPNAEFLQGDRKKSNLSAARFLHVDLDHKDYPGSEAEQEERVLALLVDQKVRPKGVPQPSALWFTGGGCQAVWRMAEPLSVEASEELSYSILAAMQGGLGTHNADRLLRLPHTVNWLNDKKRAAGRQPELAVQLDPVQFDAPPRSYTLDAFSVRMTKHAAAAMASLPSAGTPVDTTKLEPLALPSDLMEVLPAEQKWVDVIVTGKNPPDHDYSSRSELVFAAVIWMIGRGVPPGIVLSIILAPDLGISAHVREDTSPLSYARRQVARATAIVGQRSGDWPVISEKGYPVAHHPRNVRYALARLGVDAQRNSFTQTDEFRGAGLDGRDLNDIAEILCSVFGRDLDFAASPAAIRREMLALAHDNAYHPVLDYLDGLIWDGISRIDRWLHDYCDADNSELNAEFGSKLLVAGVRRIKQPGVKFDTMLVLEGAQGAGKSRLAQRLAVRDEWFCGSLDLKSDDKTKAELLARAWIVECQELDGLNKSTSQNLKRFLSTPIDTYRRAYGRDAGEYRRHCIILGTTNETAYLRDLTGNRRIWPVLVGRIDLERFDADVDQLWAEAVAREREGGALTLSPHLWADAAALQGERMVEDAFADVLEDAFGAKKGRVSMDSVKLLLGLDTARMSPADTRRIKAAMSGLGWEYCTQRLHDLGQQNKAQRKGFARGDADERKVEFLAQPKPGGITMIVTLESSTKEEPPF